MGVELGGRTTGAVCAASNDAVPVSNAIAEPHTSAQATRNITTAEVFAADSISDGSLDGAAATGS